MLAQLSIKCAGLALLSTVIFENPQGLMADGQGDFACASQGHDIDGKLSIPRSCPASYVEVRATWKRNVWFLTQAFNAIDRLQCEPLMRSAEDLIDRGTDANRLAIMDDLRKLSDLLRLAAETARLNARFLPEAASRARDLERNYLWGAALVDGPFS